MVKPRERIGSCDCLHKARIIQTARKLRHGSEKVSGNQSASFITSAFIVFRGDDSALHTPAVWFRARFVRFNLGRGAEYGAAYSHARQGAVADELVDGAECYAKVSGGCALFSSWDAVFVITPHGTAPRG